MKKWIQLLVLVGAGAYVAKRLNSKPKVQFKPVAMQDPKVQTKVQANTLDTELSDALVQSFHIQVMALMSTYPSGKQIDLVHRISFKDFTQLHAFSQSYAHLNIEDDMDQLMVMIKEEINTDAQMALEAIVKMAQAAHDHQATYQTFNLENLR
jgi:hypothetical protein